MKKDRKVGNQPRYHLFQKTGDIVFVNPHGKLHPNPFFQGVVTGRKARHSHVLLCVMPGLFVHSVPEGVRFLAAEDFHEVSGSREWEVRRNKNFLSNVELSVRLESRAAFYLGQRYNWIFLESGYLGERYGNSHSFCSELIARIYADLRIPLDTGHPPRKPEKVLPVHLELWTRSDVSSDWADVTQEYRGGLEDALDVEMFFEDLYPMPDFRLMFVKSVTSMIKLVKLLDRFDRHKKEFGDLLQNVTEKAGDMSTDQIHKIATSLGVKDRSIKEMYQAALDHLLVLNESASTIDLRSKKSKQFHFSHKPIDEVTEWTSSMNILGRYLTSVQHPLDRAVNSIADSIEAAIMYLSITQTDNPPAKARGPLDQVSRKALEMIDMIEDYDNYEQELLEFDDELRGQFASHLFTHPKTCAAARMLVRTVQWRLSLLGVRKDLKDLCRNPVDFDAAYRLYTTLIRLLPTTTATTAL